MAFDAGLAERIREVLVDVGGVTERKMFGGLAFLIHGNMFVGVVGETLMARDGADRYQAALAREFAREMDFTGKPMKGNVYVEPDGTRADVDLALWVGTCLAFVRTLPRKAGKG